VLGGIGQHLLEQRAGRASLEFARSERLSRLTQRPDQAIAQQLKIAKTLHARSTGRDDRQFKSVWEGFADRGAKKEVKLGDLSPQRAPRGCLVNLQPWLEI